MMFRRLFRSAFSDLSMMNNSRQENCRCTSFAVLSTIQYTLLGFFFGNKVDIIFLQDYIKTLIGANLKRRNIAKRKFRFSLQYIFHENTLYQVLADNFYCFIDQIDFYNI